jgi:protein-tyrosine-phosphatase
VSCERTALFVCLHGAGMSRLAAALSNRAAPAGWTAISARVDPAETLSATAETLLAGTGAESFRDRLPPRSIAVVPDPQRVVALRNPAIHYELPATETWDLSHSSVPCSVMRYEDGPNRLRGAWLPHE